MRNGFTLRFAFRSLTLFEVSTIQFISLQMVERGISHSIDNIKTTKANILGNENSKEKKEPNCQILFQSLFCEKVLLTRETKSDTNLKTFITEAKIVFRVEN